jgi:hypothetical protein
LSIPNVLLPVKGTTTASKRTAPGQYNISNYNFGTDSSKTYIDWADE